MLKESMFKRSMKFDEAHNLESICKESSSFESTSLSIPKCINLIKSIEKYTKNKREERLNIVRLTIGYFVFKSAIFSYHCYSKLIITNSDGKVYYIQHHPKNPLAK